VRKTFILAAAALLIPFSRLTGESPVQCANLIFAGTNTSRCFSDEFLSAAQRQTSIPAERRFKSVRLDSAELFKYPFVIMTGESEFRLSSAERTNLKDYLGKGGFMLSSAGCSSKKFDKSFRKEIESVFGKDTLEPLPPDHAVFNTVNKITEMKLKHSEDKARLYGLKKGGKTVLIYSPHGLNDTEHTSGCCCCGGNEIENSIDMNVNILVYSLLH
jgi:hypothetical protein